MLARQAILAGDASVVVAGGQESMSQSVHACAMREGTKFGGKELVDTMLTPYAGTAKGTPAAKAAWRTGFWPWPPTRDCGTKLS